MRRTLEHTPAQRRRIPYIFRQGRGEVTVELKKPGDSKALPQPLQTPNEIYKFVAPVKGRAVLYGSLLAFVVLTAVATYFAVRDQQVGWIIVACCSAFVMVVLWTVAQMRIPQIVTIRNSILEIKRHGKVERFDLVDPSVEVLGRDGEMAFRCYDGRFAVVHARDVPWKMFTDVVMHYQNHADRKAEERAQRWRA